MSRDNIIGQERIKEVANLTASIAPVNKRVAGDIPGSDAAVGGASPGGERIGLVGGPAERADSSLMLHGHQRLAGFEVPDQGLVVVATTGEPRTVGRPADIADILRVAEELHDQRSFFPEVVDEGL